MMLTGLALVFVGLFLLVQGAAVGGVLVLVGFVIEFTGPYLHDRTHRLRGEEPHAMWGEGNRS